MEYIRVEFSTASLFGLVSAEDLGADEAASVKQFKESLENHLMDRYPGVQVEVIHSINDCVKVDYMTDHDDVPWVEQVIERVYNGDSWLVGRD